MRRRRSIGTALSALLGVVAVAAAVIHDGIKRRKRCATLLTRQKSVFVRCGFVSSVPTFSRLIPLSFTFQSSKFRNQFKISSKYFDMACCL